MVPGSKSSNRISLNMGSLPEGLNLKHVYYFHAVASEGSIARAARALGVSQSTISEQIKALEDFLETPLFDRRKGGLQLNDSGRQVHEHSQVIFKAARRLILELNPARLQTDWILEVGITPTVSRSVSTQRLLPLFELENVSPKVRFGMYGDLLEDLLGGELDLLVSENEPPQTHRSKLGITPIAESPLVVVAAPQLAQKVKKFPTDLSAVPLVNYTQNSRYRLQLDNWLLDEGLNPEVAGAVDDVSLLASLAIRGIGAVVVPEAVAKPSLESGRLELLGRVDNGPAVVFAHYTEVNTSELVRRAVASMVDAALDSH